jgi:hypothetical protein
VSSAWPGTLLRTVAVPLLVVLPMIAVAPKADNRFNIYRFGSEYEARPWLIVTDQLRSISGYIEAHGNFRPLGRMMERSFDLLAYVLADALVVPANTAMRLVHLAAIAILALVLVLVAETVTSPGRVGSVPPSNATQLLPFAFAATLVAAGTASTLVIFTDLYFVSMALTLAIAISPARVGWLTSRGLTPLAAVAAIVLGAAMASFNEITALAPPLAFVAVLVRGRLVLRMSWKDLLRSRAAFATLLGTLTFAVIFVPVRVMIAARCADGGCYSASDVSLDPALWPAFLHRSISWLPFLQWREATASASGNWFLTSNFVIGIQLLLLVLLAWQAARSTAGCRLLSRRSVLALGTVGLTTLILGSIMAALSAGVQSGIDTWQLGRGWRDAQVAAAGGALTAAALLSYPLTMARRPSAATGVGLSVLTALAGLTLLANQTFATFDARRLDSTLNNQIALSIVHTSRDPESNAARCRLLEEFFELHPDRPGWHKRLQEALDAANQARGGTDYCIQDE